MAVTITDNRTILDEADAVTNFNQGTQNTADYAESTASVSLAINIATDQIYYNGTIPDLTAPGTKLIYLWSSNTATQNSWNAGASSSHATWLSDSTDDLVLLQAGNDREVFKHFETQVQFQCFVIDIDYLDTKNADGEIYVAAGSYGAFDKTAITEIGGYYVTTSKALGGGYNAFIDVIRYGTDGITVYGGTTGDRGTFDEIATEDRSKSNQKALGIIREYTANTYGCQGTLQFGTTAATGDAWFDDSGISLTFEDRDVADDKFKLIVKGNSTDSNNFYLSNSSINSARPGVTIDTSSANIDVLDLDSVVFNNLLNPIYFPTDLGTHSVTGCTFTACGQIDPGKVTFTGNTISNTTASGTGALLLDSDGTDNWANLNINSGNSGHGIYITVSGTYTFDNIQMVGYGATGTADAAIYNNSGGAVTINSSGSSGLTYLNGASASTSVISSVTITLTGLIANSEVRIYDVGTQTELDGIENSGTSFGFTLNNATYPYVDIVIHHLDYEYYRVSNYEVPSTSTSLPIAQRKDRWYDNP